MAAETMRASDADRERTATLLRDHYGVGRLSDDELNERIDAAYHARTVGELATLTDDLPSAPRPRRKRRSGLETSWRIHFTTYALVNLMLIGIWAAAGGGYFWPIWVMLGWGIGVAAHGAPLLATGSGSRRQRVELAATPPVPELTPAPRRASRSDSRRPDDVSSVDEVAESVESERPSLRSAAAPDGTVTILFSDIEGSTALNERLGDVRWFELLREHNRVVREQVADCSGFEVKAQGDGFMIAFPSARRAIACAVEIQGAIGRELGSHPDGPVRVRIGLHTGEAIREESDFYGKNVAVAARVADQARGGEILVSTVVHALVESAGDVSFSEPREVTLAGLAGTHLVYPVVRPPTAAPA